MRTIEKGKEPPSLRLHRKSGGTYETYAQTDELRASLLAEQGHLCCYCMKRISLRTMKIEHWASQSDNEDRTVDYDNLMGACTGGDGERKALQHCDTSRGNTPLKVNPLDRTQRCERLLGFLASGEIFSTDPEIHRDLDVTLNLNNERIKPKRKAILDSLLHRLGKEAPGYWPREMLERELDTWKMLDASGMYREYCQVAIYFLEKKLKHRGP